jgi:hypothetical protein
VCGLKQNVSQPRCVAALKVERLARTSAILKLRRLGFGKSYAIALPEKGREYLDIQARPRLDDHSATAKQ